MATSSYLQFPRINFEGKFNPDVATNNNERLNFLFASISKEDMLLDGRGSFNKNGANTWSFVDCKVTSVAYGIDNIKVDSEDDSLIGLPLVNNPNTAPAKLVDIDVDEQLLSSVIHGMKLGINYDSLNPKPNSFIGDFKPAVVASDWWDRQAKSEAYFQQTIGTRVVSRIENVTWSKVESLLPGSKALELLQEALTEEGTALSIRFTLFNYSKNPSDNWFTYGNVVGSIGISKKDDSLQFPESRVMEFLDNPPLNHTDEDCRTIGDWMHGAYFDIDMEKSTISIDMSNSFAIGVQGKICKLFKLYLGITETEGSDTKFKIIGEVPYQDETWYNKKAGIFDFKLDKTQIDLIQTHSKVVVVTTEGEIEIGKSYESCYMLLHRETQFSPSSDNDSCACVYRLLEETACMIRPMDIFVNRMEKHNTADIRLKMNYFGEKRPGRTIKLHDTSPNGRTSETAISYHGKDTTSNAIDLGGSNTKTATTDSNGIATFVFKAGDVGEPRGSIRMDGQIFSYRYSSHDCILQDNFISKQSAKNICTPKNEGNYFVFLIWSPFTEVRPYFWDKHIEPIFKQYENLYPAMSSIVRLGDYDDVTKPHNVKLILNAMNLPEEHVSYMPVTRDLSPSKRNMILEWLKTPNLPRSWEDIDRKLFETPAYCDVHFLYNDKEEPHMNINSNNADTSPQKSGTGSKKKKLAYRLAESKLALHFSNILSHVRDQNLPSSDVLEVVDEFVSLTIPASKLDSSELMWQKCETKDDLIIALQTAIALEFSTIPPYMTALYSIKDGFNQEVYSIIRSVVMQEMLHMAQAANLLISIGGKPKMENPKESFIPKCFPTNLPGDVLPNLTVRLAKASPQHIRDIFMMIEFPDKIVYDGNMHVGEKTANALTIGTFYSKIEKCMEDLDEKRLLGYPVNPETDNFMNQLKWPWKMSDSSSKLYQVKCIEDAKAAIAMIVEQGEGTDQLDPTYLGTQELAHFYKFGEIACKKHLNSSEDHKTYSYKGEDIEFVSEGVWPMRDNPASKNIPPNTHVYHQAKVFHNMYLSLLNSLQIVFNGKPEELDEAIYVMEAMQIQAKRLMQMEIPAPDGHMQTCGPIFDYVWRDPECGPAAMIEEHE